MGNIVYSCIFFKEINSHRSFHVQEDYSLIFFSDRYAHNFFFTGKLVYFSSMHYLFELDSERQNYVSSIYNFFFYKNILLSIYYTFFGKFHQSDTKISPVRHQNFQGGPRGVMVKAMDCGIVISEFILPSRYYVQIPLGRV